MGDVGFKAGAEEGGSSPRKKAAKGKKKGKTAKQKKYVANRKKGMRKTEAAIAAGYSKYTAKNAAVTIETPEMLEEIENFSDALAQAISNKRLIHKLDEGLDATLVKTAMFEGAITDVKEFIDYPTRLAYLTKVAEMSKRYSPKDGGNTFNGPVQVIIENIGQQRAIEGTPPAQAAGIVEAMG